MDVPKLPSDMHVVTPLLLKKMKETTRSGLVTKASESQPLNGTVEDLVM